MEKKDTKLKTHIVTAGIKQAALAAKVGISRPYMSQIVSGERAPALALALAIERATLGAVTVKDLVRSDGVQQ